jgi:hypothetical protein
MFLSGRKLPQLQDLAVWSLDREGTAAGTVTAAELRSMIDACPALCELDITGILQAGPDVAVLRRLPSTCCCLSVGGAAFGDSAASVIAQVTQLTALTWSFSDNLADGGLQLTGLRQLQSLTLCDSPLDMDDDIEVGLKEGEVITWPLELKAGAQVRAADSCKARVT